VLCAVEISAGPLNGQEAEARRSWIPNMTPAQILERLGDIDRLRMSAPPWLVAKIEVNLDRLAAQLGRDHQAACIHAEKRIGSRVR